MNPQPVSHDCKSHTLVLLTLDHFRKKYLPYKYNYSNGFENKKNAFQYSRVERGTKIKYDFACLSFSISILCS